MWFGDRKMPRSSQIAKKTSEQKTIYMHMYSLYKTKSDDVDDALNAWKK